MQFYCRAYQIYKGSCNMDQKKIMWTNIIQRKPRVHLRYIIMTLKVATQGGAPQRRPNMEPRDIQWKIPLVRTLTTPRNLLVVKLVPILEQEERRGNIPRVMTLKILRNSNHPLSMERLRTGKNYKFGFLA